MIVAVCLDPVTPAPEELHPFGRPSGGIGARNKDVGR